MSVVTKNAMQKWFKMVQKYLKFCDNKKVWKYTLQLS